jgi:hypothetical protein
VHLPEAEHWGVYWLKKKLPAQSLSLLQVQALVLQEELAGHFPE